MGKSVVLQNIKHDEGFFMNYGGFMRVSNTLSFSSKILVSKGFVHKFTCQNSKQFTVYQSQVSCVQSVQTNKYWLAIYIV